MAELIKFYRSFRYIKISFCSSHPFVVSQDVWCIINRLSVQELIVQLRHVVLALT